MLIGILLVSFFTSIILFPVMIFRLKKAGIVGKNMNSEKQEEVAEMGGLVIIAGFGSGIFIVITVKTFFHLFPSIDIISVLVALSTILIVVLIGIFDDLVSMPQQVKAFMPVLAALPLVVIKEGSTFMIMPFLGNINFGLLYTLVIIPLEVTIAANAVNMLAGFNGIEVGMGIIAMGSLAVIAYLLGKMTVLVILLAALGALLATLYYNWYPAKILVGDVGTLSIGAIIAAAVIMGNFEIAGIILLIPYVIDFLIKAKHHFPYSFGIYREGKLYCPEDGPVGLGQLIMKVCGGINERNLVLLMMGIEAVLGVVAILFYV
ncbi:MAG TPA: UDP-N-acetylglucosamine--dolichyl-phosphate N-acetylglucosaminephosphotransferase [Candidatus Atribacteria bacterium]|nr:UDP-N-acetylglucosamine--dolichyl-phosphate N-acetylglucosaminephosphotransferase [Candidatus Atribacteria bacterium]